MQDDVAKIKSIATNLPAEETIARYWRSYKQDGGDLNIQIKSGLKYGFKPDEQIYTPTLSLIEAY